MLVAAVFGAVVPVFGSIYLAHYQSMQEEISFAHAVSAQVMRRAEEIARDALAAEAALQAVDSGAMCSDQGINLMRDLVLQSDYLRLVGHVESDVLQCSSLGRSDSGIVLGPSEYVDELGVGIRKAIDLGLGGDQRFLAFERNGVFIAVNSGSPVDIFLERDDITVGVYGRNSGNILSQDGEIAPDVDVMRRSSKITHFNGAYLRALAHSSDFNLTAYTLIPASHLKERLNSFATVLVPLGVLIGAGTAIGLYSFGRRRTSLPNLLRDGLKRREFELHYQPIVDMRTGKVAGVEALLRWPQVNGRAALGPDLFIPVAEETGLITRFTEFVIHQVSLDAPTILKAIPGGYISINLSAQDLSKRSTIELLRELTRVPGVSPANIMVEATEHSLVDTQAAAAIVSEIRELGLKVVIDDFGTGYSCLANLTELHVDYLKIDKTFVDAVGKGSAISDVILHIIEIAKSLKLEVIAEGVESQVQAEFLREHNTWLVQGWLLAKAMPVKDLVRFAGGSHSLLQSGLGQVADA